MKIYVAARFHEKERVRNLYQQLKELGHEITLDWTQCPTKNPFSAHQDGARKCAEHTIEGVKECDAFIFLTNPEVGAGSSTELGAALMAHTLFKSPRIYIVGPHIERNFCFYHPAVHMCDTIDKVLQKLETPTKKQKSSRQLNLQ